MNASKIYTTAAAIYTTADELIKAIRRETVTADGDALESIYKIWDAAATLRDEAAEEMRREANKQSGRATIAAAALRVLKEANAQPRESLHGASRSADGYINICDYCRLLRFNASTAPELPERPESLPPYIDAARLYNGNARDHSDPVNLPEPATLRAFIKMEKARKKAIKDKTPPLYTVTTDAGALIYLNALFLLDMLEALPSAKAYAADRVTAAPTSCIIFEADNGRGLLLPVRPPKQ